MKNHSRCVKKSVLPGKSRQPASVAGLDFEYTNSNRKPGHGAFRSFRLNLRPENLSKKNPSAPNNPISIQFHLFFS